MVRWVSEMCVKTEPSPISLQLKFYEGSSDEKVFGRI